MIKTQIVIIIIYVKSLIIFIIIKKNIHKIFILYIKIALYRNIKMSVKQKNVHQSSMYIQY